GEEGDAEGSYNHGENTIFTIRWRPVQSKYELKDPIFLQYRESFPEDEDYDEKDRDDGKDCGYKKTPLNQHFPCSANHSYTSYVASVTFAISATSFRLRTIERPSSENTQTMKSLTATSGTHFVRNSKGTTRM